MTQELKNKYSNYNDTTLYYEAISLYHPNFDHTGDNNVYPENSLFPGTDLYPTEYNEILNSFYLVRNIKNLNFKIDNVSKEFNAYPFVVKLPTVGDSKQDLQISLDNVSLLLMKNLNLASENPSIPITLSYYVFLNEEGTSQIEPIRLTITNVSITGTVVSLTASRSNLYARKFPYGKGTVYDQRFQGLYL